MCECGRVNLLIILSTRESHETKIRKKKLTPSAPELRVQRLTVALHQTTPYEIFNSSGQHTHI